MNTLHREEVLQAERRHAAAEGHAKSLLSREAELSTQLTQVFFFAAGASTTRVPCKHACYYNVGFSLPEHQQLACLTNMRVIIISRLARIFFVGVCCHPPSRARGGSQQRGGRSCRRSRAWACSSSSTTPCSTSCRYERGGWYADSCVT